MDQLRDFALGQRALAKWRAPTPVPTFMTEQADEEPDPRRIIAQIVEFWQGGLARTAPVFRVIRQAAALDPKVAALERQRAEQRLRNYGKAARVLEERGALRPGLSRDDAAAATSPWATPTAIDSSS